jgi:hypothetical protein
LDLLVFIQKKTRNFFQKSQRFGQRSHRPPLRLGLVEDRAAGAKSLGPEEHAAGQGQEAEDRIDVAIYYDTV